MYVTPMRKTPMAARVLGPLARREARLGAQVKSFQANRPYGDIPPIVHSGIRIALIRVLSHAPIKWLTSCGRSARNF